MKTPHEPFTEKPSYGLNEALTCIVLGLRDGVRPPISLISAALWLGCIVLWALFFYFARDLLGSLIPELTGWAHHLSVLARWLAGFFLYSVSVLITVRIAVELILMRRIQIACLKHYPGLSREHKNSIFLTFGNILTTWIAFAIAALLGLIIPVVGPVVVFVAFGYLNLRSLMNDAFEGVASDDEKRWILRHGFLAMTVIGTGISLLLLLPVIGLLAPSILGASACHFVLRQVQRLRQSRARQRL